MNPLSLTYHNITFNGQTIIICPNNTAGAASIPKTNLAPQAFSGIGTEYALILLKNGLDFEATPSYLLRMKVESNNGFVGRLLVQVRRDLLCFLPRVFSL